MSELSVTAMAVATVVCAIVNVAIATADLAPARFVLANSAEVGVSRRALPYLAGLKAAGAVGLALGLAGFTPLGLAAAVGLSLFYLGAVGAHVRASVFYNIAFPMVFLALALCAVGYFAARLA